MNAAPRARVQRRPVHGVLLLDKPLGLSSNQALQKAKWLLRAEKAGHTGTLDPFATGLMIVVVDKECKNAGFYSKLDKVYEATIQLGTTSSTGDPEGELTVVSSAEPSQSAVLDCLEQFVGPITQTPPIYSAIKIGGQRAYARARRGEVIEMPTRQVEVYSLELLDYSYPDVSIRVHVSSGTYIRSLATDIGEQLATGAYCRELRRTAVGKWSIDDAMTLGSFGITS